MKIIAPLFKLLFRKRFFRDRYYGFYKHIFIPLGLFKGQTTMARYNKNMKMKLELDEWIQQHVYFLGVWDEPATNFMKKQLKRGDVFVDVGANIGCFTLLASGLTGEKGKVFAFEPVGHISEKLRYHTEINNLTNVVLNRKAVYEENTNLSLYLSDRANLGMSSIFHHDTEDGNTEEVEAVSLDNYFRSNNPGRVDLIKIDVEGAEIFVLRGMKETLGKYRPFVIMEISDEVIKCSGITAKELLVFMREQGYEVKGISREGEMTESVREPGYTNCVFVPCPGSEAG